MPLLGFGGTLFGGSFNTIIGIIFLAIVLVSPDGLMGIWDRLSTEATRRPARGRSGGVAEPAPSTHGPRGPSVAA